MFSMKNISLAVLAVAGLMSASVQAASTGPYLGAKIGSYMVDDSGTGVDFKNATSFGLLGGYHFGDGLSAEVEYNTSSGTDVSVGSTAVGDYDLSNFGVYGVYRFYPATMKGLSLKAKLGVISEKLDINSGFASDSETDSGLSFGVGAGFALTPQISLEGEYTVIEQDVNLLSLGLNFKL
jgi:opacity protein-like surface antigen